MDEPVRLEVDPEQARVKRAARQLRDRPFLYVQGRDGTVLFVLVTPAYFQELQARERGCRGEP